MKYLAQITSQGTILPSQSQLTTFKDHHDFERQNNKENMKILSEKDQNLQTVNMNFKFSQRIYKGLTIDDLLDMISKSIKTQISKTSKLFQQLSYLLNQSPHRIVDIKPSKGFLSNLVEYTRKLGQKQQLNEKNPIKACKVFLNSLFYILMLVISGGKQKHINENLREKLFNNKTFLKNLLAIDIYDRKQISKIYVMIVTYVYKLKPDALIKKKIGLNIIRNLKHFNGANSKTTLNLLMILNELKFELNLKQSQVRQYNLIETTENIFHANKQHFQSIHALKYYLHLINRFPELGNRPTSNLAQKFQLTQTVKKYIIESLPYQNTYLKYLEHNINVETDDKVQKFAENSMKVLIGFFNSFKKDFLTRNTSEMNFLLNMVQIAMKSVKKDQIVLWMIDQGLIRQIISILKIQSLDFSIQHRLIQTMTLCLKQLQSISSNLHLTFLIHISSELRLIQAEQDLIKTSKYFFLQEINSKISKLSSISIKLQ